MLTDKQKNLKRLEEGKDVVLVVNEKERLKDELAARQYEVALRLQNYRRENRLSIKELADQLGRDESFMRRVLWGTQNNGIMISLKIIDPIFSELGLELPPLFVKAWLRIE